MSKSHKKHPVKLEQAMTLHMKGDLQGAVTAYLQVVSVDKNNYLALSNLGTVYLSQCQWKEAQRYLEQALKIDESNAQIQYKIAISLHQQGKLVEAIHGYRKAVALHLNIPELYANLGIVLHQSGHFAEAVSSFEQAIALKPDYPDAYSSMGLALKDQGHLEAAMNAFEQALALQPRFPAALYNRGVTFHQQGKLDEAIDSYRQALSLHSNYPEVCYNLGAALQLQGKLDEAIATYQQALRLKPNYPEVLSNLGVVLKHQKRLEEAILAFQQAIALKPDYPAAYLNLGLLFYDQKKFEDAVSAYEQAIRCNSGHAEAYYNLGSALYNLQQYEDAITAYRQALLLKPVYPEALSNLAIALKELGHLNEAIRHYQESIALKPDYAIAHLNLAMLLLLLEDYEAGWPEYRWRFAVDPASIQLPRFEQWNGVLQGEQELVLVEEQGLGDVIHFMRYGKLLKQWIPRVSIAVQENLVGIVESTKIYDQVYPLHLLESTVPAGAKWIPILSIPEILGVTKAKPLLEDVYIPVDKNKAEQWRTKMRTAGSLIVGLNWQGNPQKETTNFKGRSFSLSEYAPLAEIPGVQFAALQKGYGSEQMETCTFLEKFVGCQSEISQSQDILETAAIIQNCDLVITSDTFIAHLASAMGRPTWILLKKLPEWRWGLEGEQCPWYPSARLFRQTETGNWTEVITRVKAALAKCVDNV